MKITKDEVLHVADLARLNLDEAAIDKFAGQIGDILDYVDKLKEVNTDGIKPTSHAIALTNAFRDDERWNVLTKKPIRPSTEEVEANPRSRSAKLRVAQRA